jgi:hypothetical protein
MIMGGYAETGRPRIFVGLAMNIIKQQINKIIAIENVKSVVMRTDVDNGGGLLE